MVNHHELTETSFIPEETTNAQELNLSTEESPKEESLKNVEEEKGRRFEVIVLPKIAEDAEGNDYLEHAKIDQENLADLETLIDYLKRIPPKLVSEYYRGQIKFIIDLYDEYERRLAGIQNARQTGELVDEKIAKQTKLSEQEVAPADEIYEKLLHHFETSPTEMITLAESHMSSYDSISAAQEAAEFREPQTAVIVFDNHQDTLGRDRPWKGNIFRLLREKGQIAGAIFFGNFQDTVTLYYSKSEESYIVPEVSSPNTKGKERVKIIVRQALEEFAKRGITNMVISIDIDVLRAREIGYTATEYNPRTILGYLSSIDLSEVGLNKKPEGLTTEEVTQLIKYVFNFSNRKRLLNPLIALDHNQNSMDPIGARLSEIGTALETIYSECSRMGIEIGIKLKGGGRYIGDIVELSGYDYKGHTTRAVSALAKKIEILSAS